MTIWTSRNEKIEGYFYTIDPKTGNCIFSTVKQTSEGNKIVKKHFALKDIVFMHQQIGVN